MIDRIMGVMRLDVPTFEAIEHDEDATMQAAIIVGVVALVGAIGAFTAGNALSGVVEQLGDLDIPDLAGRRALSPAGLALNSFISTFVGWVVWSYATYFIGTRVFAGKATPGEMLRVIGFAQAPRILALIPCLGFIGTIYALVTSFVGIRQGLDLDNGKTFLTVILSWLAAVIVGAVIGTILGVIGLAA